MSNLKYSKNFQFRKFQKFIQLANLGNDQIFEIV